MIYDNKLFETLLEKQSGTTYKHNEIIKYENREMNWHHNK
jgi:hypothetical protein